MSRHLNEQLVDAACKGNTVTIRKLIRAGADPNYLNEQINTPLMWAVTHRHLDAAQVLLESGADVNGQDALGGTALIVAASNGDLPMLEMLLRAGAGAHVTDVTAIRRWCGPLTTTMSKPPDSCKTGSSRTMGVDVIGMILAVVEDGTVEGSRERGRRANRPGKPSMAKAVRPCSMPKTGPGWSHASRALIAGDSSGWSSSTVCPLECHEHLAH